MYSIVVPNSNALCKNVFKYQSQYTTNTTQILNDIQSLQSIEQQLFNSLEENTGLTSEQQKKMIEKINNISSILVWFGLHPTTGEDNEKNGARINFYIIAPKMEFYTAKFKGLLRF